MISDRFVAFIEKNAHHVTRQWIDDVRQSPQTPSYHNIPVEQLHGMVFDVYRRLGEWMSDTTGSDDAAVFFARLGRTRAQQGFRLSEVIFAVMLSKRCLLRYVDRQGFVGDAIGISSQMEFHDRIGMFFDKVVYLVCVGFENVQIVDEKFYEHGGVAEKTVDAFMNWIVKRR
jgi:hypothetical protein